MRLPSEIDAEYAVLTTRLGSELLADVASIAAPGPAELARWRKMVPAEWVPSALLLVQARRKGAAKFPGADAMWLDPVGVEQATAEAVSRHKARRFAESPGVVDLCCGIGGDATSLAGVGPIVMAVDRDQGMARRTAWNARVAGVADRLLAVRARAEAFPRPDGWLVHIDPDRRAGSAPDRRARAVRNYVPGLDFLHSLIASTPGGAIKLSPASDFEAQFGDPRTEIEIVSLDGECKEATVWFGRLVTCRRRATVLPAGISWTDRDGPVNAPIRLADVSSWIFEPDAALVRSGLLDAFAAAHNLARIAPGVDFLTGPSRVESPFLVAFEVEEVFPLDRKRLRKRLRERAVGSLEIKTRGLDLRPEDLRRELTGTGPETATLVLVGGRQAPAQAILTRRVRTWEGVG